MRLGILGGGQLAQMMAVEARRLGIKVHILDPDPDCSARSFCDTLVTGSFKDRTDIERFAAECDALTFDIEHVAADVLGDIVAAGGHVSPSPDALQTIQDKLLQKEALAEAGVAVPRFVAAAPDAADLRTFGFPLIQKARRGGYDGRGVVRIEGETRLGKMLNTASLLEECVPIEKELSVLVARSAQGEVRTYRPIEMVFHQEANVLDYLISPAAVTNEVATEAIAIAGRAVEVFGLVGITAVELFLTHDGRILVNELAPRPHNSGHHTLESATTSQFEQHVRAVCGLPLGDVRETDVAATFNVLGPTGRSLDGYPLQELLALPGVAPHWYHKSASRPGRKMGHVTIVGPHREEVLETMSQAKALLVKA